MTDKEKIRLQAIKIIDGLNKSCTPNPNGNIMECMAAAEIEALKLIVDYIDSLPKEEPVSEGFISKPFNVEIDSSRSDGRVILSGNFFEFNTGDKARIVFVKSDI